MNKIVNRREVFYEILNWVKKYIFLFLIIYRFILSYIYEVIINRFYEYYGFVINVTEEKFLIANIFFFIITILFVLFYRNYEDSISYNCLGLLYLLYFVPNSVLLQYGAISVMHGICTTLYFFISIIIFVISSRKVIRGTKIRRKFNNKYSKNLFCFLCWFTIAIVFCVSYYYTGFRLNFDMSKIYDYRLEARNYNMQFSLAYLYNWTSVILPIVFIYAMNVKKPILGVFCIMAEILKFGVDSQKSSAIIFVASILFYFLKIRLKRLHLFAFFFIGMILICVCSLFEYFYNDTYWICSIFIRRMLFIPSFLGDCYLNFIQQNEPDLFRASFLRHFGFKSPYASDISFLIGDIYFNSPDMRCNTGLLGDAYANLGIIGVFFMPFILVLVLKILENAIGNVDIGFILVLLLFYASTMINGYILPVLTNHGMLAVCIMLKLMNNIRNTN